MRLPIRAHPSGRFGAGLFLFGLVFGLYHWITAPAHEFVPTGTIMIAAITFLMGFQLLMGFLNYDISAAPREPLHPHLEPLSHKADAADGQASTPASTNVLVLAESGETLRPPFAAGGYAVMPPSMATSAPVM